MMYTKAVLLGAVLLACLASTGWSASLGQKSDDLSNDINSFPPPKKDKVFLPSMLSYVFDVLNIKGVVKDVQLGKASSSTCTACKFGVSMLRSFIESGKQEKEIANMAKSVCKTLALFTTRVCDGVINVFKDQVIDVMSQVVLSSDEVCGLLLGSTCADVVNPLHNWTIPMPSKPKPPFVPVQPPKSGSPTMKVLHITDIHYDPYYSQGVDTQCREPLCCRLGDDPGKTPETTSGKYGDYHDCDTSMATLENMLDHITENHKIDYVMWTGDVAPHDIWNSTRWENLHIIDTINALLKNKFKDVPVYASLGNHETVPVNSFPPPELKGKYDISWLYNELVNAWGVWLPKEAEATLRRGGFYRVKVQPGLRIIAINSNYCNSMNWWLLLNSTDPAQQLQWLVDELLSAEKSGDKVHIISHIPPGKYDCMKTWSKNFYAIINRFESTVMAQFYGHTHQDEFEVFYDEETSRPTNVAYISPSVTTYGGVNPGFRIFTMDGNYPGSTRAVLDHETYYMNLTEANNGLPLWNRVYSAKEIYKMKDLQPDSWNKLIQRLSNDDHLFETFYSLYNVLSDFAKKECVGSCKEELICQLKTARSNDLSLCQKIL